MKLKFFLLAPCTFLISIFIFGFCDIAAQSIGFFGIFESGEFISSLFFTVYIALSSSLLSALLGACAAILIFHTGKSRIFEKFFLLPVLVPHFVAALLMFNLLSNFGILARIFGALPAMVFDKYAIGVITSYIWKGFPFIALLVLASLRRFDTVRLDAARSLGAGTFRASLDMILPHIAPSIKTGFILLFVFSLGAFEIPFLLGATSPRTLPVMAYSYYVGADTDLHRISMAICVLLSILSFLLVLPVLPRHEKT